MVQLRGALRKKETYKKAGSFLKSAAQSYMQSQEALRTGKGLTPYQKRILKK